MSLGSLAWWLRSSVLAFGLVTFPSLIMVGLVPALCVPGSVLTISRPSVLGSGVIQLLPRSIFLFFLVPPCWSLLSVLFNTMFGKAGWLGFGKHIPNVAGMRSSPSLSLIKISLLWMSKTFVLGFCPAPSLPLSGWVLRSGFCFPVGGQCRIMGAHHLGLSKPSSSFPS